MGAGSSTEPQSPQDETTAAGDSQPASPGGRTPTEAVAEAGEPEDPSKVPQSPSHGARLEEAARLARASLFLEDVPLRILARKLSGGAPSTCRGARGHLLPFANPPSVGGGGEVWRGGAWRRRRRLLGSPEAGHCVAGASAVINSFLPFVCQKKPSPSPPAAKAEEKETGRFSRPPREARPSGASRSHLMPRSLGVMKGVLVLRCLGSFAPSSPALPHLHPREKEEGQPPPFRRFCG